MRGATLLIFVSACSGAPTEPTPIESTNAEVVLGKGLETFVALTEGDELLIEQGYQGGFHLSVNARASGVEAVAPVVTFWAELAETDGFEACRGRYERVKLAEDSEGWLVFPAGARCFVGDPSAVTMRRVLLHVEVETAAGERATDTREIRLGRILRPY